MSQLYSKETYTPLDGHLTLTISCTNHMTVKRRICHNCIPKRLVSHGSRSCHYDVLLNSSILCARAGNLKVRELDRLRRCICSLIMNCIEPNNRTHEVIVCHVPSANLTQCYSLIGTIQPVRQLVTHLSVLHDQPDGPRESQLPTVHCRVLFWLVDSLDADLSSL